MMKSSTNSVIITNTDHLNDIFDYVNSHLTIMESNTIQYNLEEDTNSRVVIPKPLEISNEEYLANYLSPVKTVTTNLIGDMCAICYQCYLPHEKYRKIKCNHIFHQNCIDTWLSQNLDDFSCPLCRKSQY